MKKIVALLFAGVLVCSMGINAFANSPSTSTTDTSVVGNSTVAEVKVWDKILVDGKESDVTVSVAAANETVVEEAKAQATAIVGKKATVLQVVDVIFPKEFKSITIPFNIVNVKEGDNIVALHQKADGSWESITPDKVDNGKVTVTFTSLSPVAFVAADGATVKSPKTGDVTVPFVAIIAVLAFAGAAVTGKKVFN